MDREALEISFYRAAIQTERGIDSVILQSSAE